MSTHVSYSLARKRKPHEIQSIRRQLEQTKPSQLVSSSPTRGRILDNTQLDKPSARLADKYDSRLNCRLVSFQAACPPVQMEPVDLCMKGKKLADLKELKKDIIEKKKIESTSRRVVSPPSSPTSSSSPSPSDDKTTIEKSESPGNSRRFAISVIFGFSLRGRFCLSRVGTKSNYTKSVLRFPTVSVPAQGSRQGSDLCPDENQFDVPRDSRLTCNVVSAVDKNLSEPFFALCF